MSATGVSLPEPNSLAEVRTSRARGWLSTQVEHTEPGLVVLAAPFDRGIPVPPVVDDRIHLRWPTPRGQGVADAVVLGGAAERALTWRVALDGPLRLVQRREAFRVAVLVPATITWPGDGTVPPDAELTGTVVDLSESGARLVATAGERRLREGVMTLRLEIADLLVEVDAEPVRVERAGGGRLSVVVRFRAVPAAVADAIRGFLFDEQRRQRARERGR
jgi:hypothetical protein